MERKTLFFLFAITIGTGMVIRTFFGGFNNSEIIHNENIGFVEQFNNTGDTQNYDTNTTREDEVNLTLETGNTADTETKNNYSTIKVMMPKYFYTSGRKSFAEDLYYNQNIYTKFVFTDDLNSYRDLLSNPDFSEADLFLFPYDRSQTTHTRPFTFQQDIQGVFDNLISSLVQDKQIKFLPFAVDPMIMYSINELAQNNFTELSDFIYNWESNIGIAFPIFFGITSEDYSNEGFSREYQDIVRYAFLHYFQKYQDSHSLGLRINTNILANSDDFRTYNIKDLNYIANTITKPECKYFRSICFQLYKFVGIRFGFLSDQDIIQKYFINKKNYFDKIYKYNMPFYPLESPVRLRGRGISNNLEDIDTINNIYKFLIKYMNEYNNYNLRSSTLSAFKKDGTSIINNQYIGAGGYILEEGGNYMDTLRSSNPFWQLIEYQISAQDYLHKS